MFMQRDRQPDLEIRARGRGGWKDVNFSHIARSRTNPRFARAASEVCRSAAGGPRASAVPARPRTDDAEDPRGASAQDTRQHALDVDPHPAEAAVTIAMGFHSFPGV